MKTLELGYEAYLAEQKQRELVSQADQGRLGSSAKSYRWVGELVVKKLRRVWEIVSRRKEATLMYLASYWNYSSGTHLADKSKGKRNWIVFALVVLFKAIFAKRRGGSNAIRV